MERMKQLQECRDDEEASQEEMATRFEREKTESMLVVSAEEDECVPSRDISRHFEDPSYGYKDFSRRGEHVPTFRAQVCLTVCLSKGCEYIVIQSGTHSFKLFSRIIAGRIMASLWSTDCIPMLVRCWTRSSRWPTT